MGASEGSVKPTRHGWNFPTLAVDQDLSHSGLLAAMELYYLEYDEYPSTLIFGLEHVEVANQILYGVINDRTVKTLVAKAYLKHCVFIPGWSYNAWGVLGTKGMVIVKGV